MTPRHRKRAAFVTIGQSPRTDMVPEMVAWIGSGLDVVEHGALDELDRDAIEGLAPSGSEHSLVTALDDGTEVVIGKEQTRDRVQHVLNGLAVHNYDLIVLLCTGYFENLHAPALLLEAQTIVDHTAAAIAEGARRVGVMVPLLKQIEEFHYRPRDDQAVQMTHASPYTAGRLEEAAHEMADADIILMHCMGYTEAMRQTVAEVSGCPVLLARKMVAAAIGQLV